MKIVFLVLLIFLTGCSNQEINEVRGGENKIEASSYQDNNQIKIGLYTSSLKHIYQTEYISSFPSLKYLGVFSIILSNEYEEWKW